MNNIKPGAINLILIGCVIVLLLSNLGLFLRMNELQIEIIQFLRASQFSSDMPKGLQKGVKAPQFSLADTTGHIVTLEDFRGQTILVVFSRTTCPACQKMYPVLKSFHESHPSQVIIMISSGTEEENRQILIKEELDFPILKWQDSITSTYQVPGTPFFYIIDGQGFILRSEFADSLASIEALFRFDH
ncbi:MAG: TlpA disulfide reductase family protein [Anaerolineaceae bacterium]|nr:TlpA disulfide reductase family protein [Anaerolineaceae bacterium]